MSFPRYESYKDSGVEWLGYVPKHWNIKRLRFVAEFNPSKSEVAALDRSTEVSFLPMEAVGDDGSISLDQTRALGDVESGYTYFREGDVTFAKITPCFENGKGAIMRGLVGGVGFGTTELIVARPRANQTTAFFLHSLFTSPPFRRLGEAFMYGAGGQKRVPDDFVRNFATAFPPLSEQSAIVAFLDRETVKIDALVDEQERLIELLKEKRQAVISHAVTKGLDPNAPTKQSGVEWLGEVPKHWDIVRAKTVYRERDERSTDGSEELLSVSHLTGVRPRSEKAVNMFEAETTEGYKKVYKTDFVINTLWAWMGAMGSSKFEGIASPNYHVYALRGDGFSADYMELMCRINSFVRFIGSRSRGVWSSRLRFYPEDFFDLMLPAPPLSEQIAIIQFVENTTGAFREITANSERAIALLEERRAALISAAVTGKIDVRGLVPMEAEAA